MAETKKKRRRVWRYLLGGLAVVALVAAIFYQPIFFSLTGFVAQRVAGAAKLSISYQAHGSIFSDLTLQNVDVHPLPENTKMPIETLQAKTVALGYNLPAALRRDWRHVVTLVRLQDVNVVIRPTPPTPKEPPSKGPLKFPAVIPERVDLDRVSVRVRRPAGDVNVQNFFLHLRQNAEGDLGWQALELPGVGHWENVRAQLTERDDVLTISDLALPPLADVHRLTLDLRRSADGVFGADLDGTVLEAPLTLRAGLQPGNGAAPTEVELRLGRIDLARLGPLLKVPVSGAVPETTASFRGDAAHPDTWDARLQTSLENAAFRGYAAQSVVLDAEVRQGSGRLNALGVRSGRNALQLAGDFQLPPDVNLLVSGSAADLGLAVALPEPERYVPDVRGAVLATGSVELREGTWKAAVRADAQGLSAKGAAVPATALDVFAAGVVPFGDDLWSSFQAVAQTSVAGATFAPVTVPHVDVTASLPGTGAAEVKASVRAGQSGVDLQARAALPRGGAAFDPKAAVATLDLAVPSLADFLEKELYAGRLGVNGRVELANLQPNGALHVAGDALSYEGATVQGLRADVQFANGEATVGPAQVTIDADNRVDLSGKAGLNAPYPYQIFGQLKLPKLANFDAFLKAFRQPEGLTGALHGTVTGTGDAQHLGGQLEATGEELGYRGFTVQSLETRARLEDNRLDVPVVHLAFDPRNAVDLTAKGELTGTRPFSFTAKVNLADLGFLNPALKSLAQPEGLAGSLTMDAAGHGDAEDPLGTEATVRAGGEGIRYRGVTVQSLAAAVALAAKRAQVQALQLTFDPRNAVDLSGDADLTGSRAFHFTGKIDLQDLGLFNPALQAFGQPEGLAGSLAVHASGKGAATDPLSANAEVSVNGQKVRYRGLTIEGVDLQAGLADRRVNVPVGRITFNPKNTINFHAGGAVQEPYAYDGNAEVAFADLGFLNELVKSFGQDFDLGGKLNAHWDGAGPLRESVGNVSLRGEGLHGKGVEGVGVELAGSYRGPAVEVPTARVRSPYANLEATARFNPQLFEIPSLRVTRAGNAVTGRARIPLDLRSGAKLPIPRDAPLDVLLQADHVSLASLQTGQPAVTGEAGFKLAVSKTLQDPSVEIGASLRDVRSPAVSAFSAVAANFLVRLDEKLLTLDGHLTQADIQPIGVTGKVPLDVGSVLDTGRLPDDTPLQFSVKWPSTNLAFLQRVVPIFRRLEGRVGADVTVGGTLKKPVLAGTVDANIPRLQAKKDVIPPLSDFVARIVLQQDKVRFDRLSGLAGGGPFRVGGGVDLANGTNPTFDISVKGEQVLLTRTDSIIARANFDLAVRGPLSAGEVSGTVGVINSRFFQDIDILPLNLPGRPAPKPPAVPPPSQVSITAPPLRDWKFNIAVRTDTPFLVQSNLARGQVTVDLRVGGTGLSPSVTGFVRVDQLTASLPFSHLDITNGYVTFSPGGNPLDPSLNIIGNSTIRDYEVRMRIFGNVSNFQILFDSTPPLAQGDIATLLATGATTSEFVENPSLLAGRASFILAQQLLTKVFKLKPNQNQQAFLERLQVDVVPGSRPGTQDVSARFSLTKNYQLIGEFGQEGNVSARVRYLIRFR